MTEETKKKISETMKGHVLSELTKLRISYGMKRNWRERKYKEEEAEKADIELAKKYYDL